MLNSSQMFIKTQGIPWLIGMYRLSRQCKTDINALLYILHVCFTFISIDNEKASILLKALLQ